MGWDSRDEMRFCISSEEDDDKSALCLAVLPDGSLASGSFDKTVKLWKDGVCTHTLEGHTDGVLCLAVLPDGSLASGSHDGTVKLWKRNRNMTPILLMCTNRSIGAAQFLSNLSGICRTIHNYYFNPWYM